MPPVRQKHGHVQLRGSCSAGANGRGLKVSDGQKMCWFHCKTPFICTNWTWPQLNLSIDQNQRASTEKRTLLAGALYLYYQTKQTALLVSLRNFKFLLLNSFILISCPFNSFSVFGHYISARLQIIWRPYLWLVWSFTQMVSFLEFSISNPVFPPPPPPPFIFSHQTPPEC